MNSVEVERLKLLSAFEDFITGKGVERSKLELIIDGSDVSGEFVASLEKLGYRRTTVSAVDALPGERVPAFYIEDGTVYFGWVFWEKFTEKKMRKLWGSVVRNRKGDWAIQILPSKLTPIFANLMQKIEMDIERPG